MVYMVCILQRDSAEMFWTKVSLALLILTFTNDPYLRLDLIYAIALKWTSKNTPHLQSKLKRYFIYTMFKMNVGKNGEKTLTDLTITPFNKSSTVSVE